MAHTANFALVMAQLLVAGDSKGVHAFLVQIRDMHSHQPMPGLTLGSIGPKCEAAQGGAQRGAQCGVQ